MPLMGDVNISIETCIFSIVCLFYCMDMVETEELTMCLMNLINGRGSFMITVDFLFKFMF